MTTGQKATHAVVIGSSMGGMCSAMVLGRHFDRVTLIERDALPTEPEHRKGVPQSHHGHVLLLRGIEELERLYPGFQQSLLDRGATHMDLGSEFAYYSEWGWAPKADSGVVPVAASRLLIEHVVREATFQRARNLEVLQGVRVRGLQTERNGRIRVTGVRVQGPDGERTIDADLVVDCSGKNGRLLDWLDQLGLPRPPEETVDSHSAYASRFYQMPDPRPPEWWWKGVFIDGTPPDDRRWGMLLPIEGNRLVLILGGINGVVPPTDVESYEAFMHTLRSPYIAQVMARCEPISNIHGNKPLYNRWRHFEKWSGQLDNYVCLGDLLCAFNPIHGQGITSAAASAANLGAALDEVGVDGVRLPTAFYARNAEFLQHPWGIATSIDLQWPETSGKRPFWQSALWPVIREIGRSVHEDPKLKSALSRGFHLLEPPTAALRPRVIARLLYSIARRHLLGPAVPEDYNPMYPEPAAAGTVSHLAAPSAFRPAE